MLFKAVLDGRDPDSIEDDLPAPPSVLPSCLSLPKRRSSKRLSSSGSSLSGGSSTSTVKGLDTSVEVGNSNSYTVEGKRNE